MTSRWRPKVRVRQECERPSASEGDGSPPNSSGRGSGGERFPHSNTEQRRTIVSDTTTADDVEEWDSLSHVRLVVAVEREWGISFTNAEIEGFKCVGDLISAIETKAA